MQAEELNEFYAKDALCVDCRSEANKAQYANRKAKQDELYNLVEELQASVAKLELHQEKMDRKYGKLADKYKGLKKKIRVDSQ